MIPETAVDSPRSEYAPLSPRTYSMRSPFIESPPNLQPPVSIVFVSESRPMTRSTIDSALPPHLKSPNPPSLQASLASTPPSPGISVANFRLLPRHVTKTIHSPFLSRTSNGSLTADSYRGRKRRAISMTNNDSTANSGVKAEFLAATTNTNTTATFGWSAGWKSLSEGETPARSPGPIEGAAFHFQGLSLKSPLRPSPLRPPVAPETESVQHSHAFSSFSRYSGSPGFSTGIGRSSNGTVGSGSEEAMPSPAMSSTRSSVKIMPLKVLLHTEPKTPSSSRPPRPSTPASSAFQPQEFEKEPSHSFLPAQVYTASSPDRSLSTIHDPDEVDPPPKQRRTLHSDSPRSRRSTPGRGMAKAHLPRTTTLTPRSDKLSAYVPLENVRPSSLPRRLAPDDELTVDSHILLQRAYEQEKLSASVAHSQVGAFPSSRNSSNRARPVDSFIPVPDWGEPHGVSTSLFTPSRSPDQFTDIFPDDESISDDSNNEFVLASPSVIAEEMSAQANFKLRRLRPAADSLGHLSSTSLLGMNFISSNTCLAGMESRPSNSTLPFLPRGQTKSGSPDDGPLRRNESQSSVGLTLDNAQSASSERDLITPPALPQPRYPPPLSPRDSHNFGSRGRGTP